MLTFFDHKVYYNLIVKINHLLPITIYNETKDISLAEITKIIKQRPKPLIKVICETERSDHYKFKNTYFFHLLDYQILK